MTEIRKRPEAQPYIMCLVCSSVVLMGRETGLPQLLAPLLLTGGKGADPVIRGNVVLNTLSARSTSTLLRDQIYINSLSSRQVSGLAEPSYATGFNSSTPRGILLCSWFVSINLKCNSHTPSPRSEPTPWGATYYGTSLACHHQAPTNSQEAKPLFPPWRPTGRRIAPARVRTPSPPTTLHGCCRRPVVRSFQGCSMSRRIDSDGLISRQWTSLSRRPWLTDCHYAYLATPPRHSPPACCPCSGLAKHNKRDRAVVSCAAVHFMRQDKEKVSGQSISGVVVTRLEENAVRSRRYVCEIKIACESCCACACSLRKKKSAPSKRLAGCRACKWLHVLDV
jgi:hypothetical protein